MNFLLSIYLKVGNVCTDCVVYIVNLDRCIYSCAIWTLF